MSEATAPTEKAVRYSNRNLRTNNKINDYLVSMGSNAIRPGLAQVFEELARRKNRTVAELADSAQLSASQLSKLRSGALKPTMAMIDRLAQAFALVPDDPNDIENTKAELLLAGGYKPDVGVTRRKELVDVLELEAELGEERKVESGQEIWIYSRRLIETDDPLIFNTVLQNLQAGIKYKFFIHPDFAMDCVTLRQKLEKQDPPIDDEAHQIIVLHRDAYMFINNRMFMAILNALDDYKLRCFKTRKQSSDVFRYIELHPAEGIEYRDFLLDMIERVKTNRSTLANRRPDEEPPLPCRAEEYAQYMYRKLMIPDAANS